MLTMLVWIHSDQHIFGLSRPLPAFRLLYFHSGRAFQQPVPLPGLGTWHQLRFVAPRTVFSKAAHAQADREQQDFPDRTSSI
jgi:hypothetical protein